MSSIRVTQLFELTSSDLSVEQFSVTFSVTAHLRYNGSIDISTLNNVTIIEAGGDELAFSDGGYSATDFATAINNTLDADSANNAGTLWVDGSDNTTNVTRLIKINSGDGNKNTVWDGSIADAFDTLVGSAILNVNGSHDIHKIL